MALLDAISAEREALQAKLAALDEIEQLAVAYEGAATAVAAPAAKREVHVTSKRALPAKPKATGQGRDGLSAASLAARGLIQVKGERAGTRYITAPHVKPSNAGTTFGSGNVFSKPAKPAPNGNVLRERILGQLKHRKLTEPQLAGVLDVSREQIADACGKLLLNDRVVMRPDGTYALPLATAA
jgi:hypothetical protein